MPVACCGASPPTDQERGYLADAQPGKTLTRCAAARWRRCARSPWPLLRQRRLHAVVRSACGLYAKRTGDMDTIAELWPAIEAALGWIDGPGVPDGDGFLEYERAAADRLVNQGWKNRMTPFFMLTEDWPKAPNRTRRGARLRVRGEAHGLRTGAAARPRRRCCEA